MIPVCVKSASSSARRMAAFRPTRPSIMSPRRDEVHACAGMEHRLTWPGWPPCGRWPRRVRLRSGHRHGRGSCKDRGRCRSPPRARGRLRLDRAHRAEHQAILAESRIALGVLQLGASSLGKSATAGMPSAQRARHSFTRSATLRRRTPGIDGMASGFPLPSTTKSGAMKSAGRRTVSSTRARRPPTRAELRRGGERGWELEAVGHEKEAFTVKEKALQVRAVAPPFPAFMPFTSTTR